MAQLKVKDILANLQRLKATGMSDEEIGELPVYIGDDDELNGIHTAWYCHSVDGKNEDDEDFIEMIDANCCNVKFDSKAILIS